MNPGVRIKTFQARSLAEALDRIRKEFGPEALILETESPKGSRFGWGSSKVRVTASSPPAIDEPVATKGASESISPLHDNADPSQPMHAPPEFTPPDEPHRSESKSQSEPRFPHAYLQASQLLGETDLDPALTRDWLGKAMKTLGAEVADAWVVRAWIAQRIRETIAIDPPTAAWENSRCVVALTGPAGQGKTSATAKLAGLAAMQLQLQPAILSYAPDGLPSRHCLSEYCHLMGWGFEQVDAPKLVPSALERLEGCDLVLIDSPCVRPGDVEAMEALRATLIAAEVSQTHLVMSALTGAPHFRRAMAWYQQLEPSHLLLTKLDEAYGLSGIYSSVLASHLPLGFASTGPGVPEDLIELDAVQAVRWVLGD